MSLRDDQHARASRVLRALLGGLALASAGCGGAASPASSDSVPIRFNAPGQLNGTVGQVFSYSFCRPALTGSADLCNDVGANPTGGQPPYHFQLGAGTGFPPSGLSLGLNGILSGTPSAAGTKTFSVCAVDLSAKSVCQDVIMAIVGTVAVGNVKWSCTISATPLPGWKNCTGTVDLNISIQIPSGYVSVYFNYPSTDSFFHGQAAVATTGITQAITVNLTNPYVSQCVSAYNTTVDVYNGSESARGALIVSVPVKLTSACP